MTAISFENGKGCKGNDEDGHKSVGSRVGPDFAEGGKDDEKNGCEGTMNGTKDRSGDSKTVGIFFVQLEWGGVCSGDWIHDDGGESER